MENMSILDSLFCTFHKQEKQA